MKLYSDKLTARDVRIAFSEARTVYGADIWTDDVQAFQPRSKYAHGVKFYAQSMHGTRPTAHRAIGSYPLDRENRAASWSDYGYVIAILFARDPGAVIGPYKCAGDFHAQVTQAHEHYRKNESVAFLDVLTQEAMS